MSTKKIVENPMAQEKLEVNKTQENARTAANCAAPVPEVHRQPMSITKDPQNELYKKLLPATLFVLTFVTVMTILLVYMDTVALGARQFRQNLYRDHELGNIDQDSEMLVAFIRQLHLAQRDAEAAPEAPGPTPQVLRMDEIYGKIYNGTFVSWLERGGRDACMSPNRHPRARTSRCSRARTCPTSSPRCRRTPRACR